VKPPLLAQSMPPGVAVQFPPGATGEPVSNRRSFVIPVLMLLALASGVVLFVFNPGQFSFYPVCWFYRTTGLLCPGCGSLRALHQLLHGHLATAFRFNPLLIFCLPFVGWVAARYAWRRMRQQPGSLAIRPVWFWLFLAGAVIFSVWRNLPGTPFATLPQ
jgi:hypothetical protein